MNNGGYENGCNDCYQNQSDYDILLSEPKDKEEIVPSVPQA